MSGYELVIKWLKLEQIDADLVSPNYVADFASNRGVYLTGADVVEISNNYENEGKS